MAPTQRLVLKTKVPFIRRRFTRSYGQGEFDFLPQLPEEVQNMILNKLPVKDLGKCLRVSKTWNKIVNVDFLWKRVCLAHGLTPTEDKKFVRDGKSLLCKWGQIWLSFRRSPAFGWRARAWRTMELDRGNIYTKNASDGHSLVFCSGTLLTLRKAAQLGKTKYTLKLPIPFGTSSNVAVDNKFIAVAKCNIILIYKLGTYRYRCILALAINDDEITKTHACIRTFVKSNLKETMHCISILAFSKSCIWLREHGRYKTYVLNLNNEKITKVEPHFYRYITNSYIVSWCRRKLRVDNYLGKNVLKLCRDINRARANNNILVTFGFKVNSEFDQVMETWQLTSGKRLLCIPRPKNAFFEIHPSKNILYQIEAGKNYVTSICALTGTELWTSKIPGTVDILDWCLRIVCERYLVLFQFKASVIAHALYVFDALNGKYLYETMRPPGHIDHLSDNLLICKTATKIFIRSFLKS